MNATNDPGGDYAHQWAPSGVELAFVSTRTGVEQVHSMTVAGSGAVRLSEGTSAANMVTWSPDGEWVAFVSGSGGNRDVYVVRRSGGPAVNLSASNGDDELGWRGLAWCPAID